jgi:hypothetical protein
MKRAAGVVAVIVVGWVFVAYVLLPLGWIGFNKRHPGLDALATVTHTATGIPGDPINVAIVGTEKELKGSMISAKWYPADPLTLESCLEIAEASILKRPYDTAPVSSLYWNGRKEDLAFEQPVGGNPRERHHVRFWRSEVLASDGRPTWVGSATFDRRVGLSHTTGEITHHIASDIDAERDHVIESLTGTGKISGVDRLVDFQPSRQGRNGGGDPWSTDGQLILGILKPTR